MDLEHNDVYTPPQHQLRINSKSTLSRLKNVPAKGKHLHLISVSNVEANRSNLVSPVLHSRF